VRKTTPKLRLKEINFLNVDSWNLTMVLSDIAGAEEHFSGSLDYVKGAPPTYWRLTARAVTLWGILWIFWLKLKRELVVYRGQQI
jgi:hypothetical protein